MPDEHAPAGLVAQPDQATRLPHWTDDTVGVIDSLAPEALAQEEARYRALVDAIRTPIVSTSIDGRITGFNAAAVALFGSPARLYARPIREILPFVHDPREPGAETQGRVADATGQTVDLEVSRTLLHEGADHAYAVYVAHDISRHAEVNRLREQLLYSVAHELRGPLMVLDNALEILDTDYDKLTAQEFAHCARQRAANGASHADADGGPAERREHSVGAFRGRAASDRARADRARSRRDHDARDRGTRPIGASRTSRARLDGAGRCSATRRQVLTNLLANASKYSPERSTIRVVARPAANMVRISVEDQGPGIAQEQQSGLFERFYRVRADTEVTWASDLDWPSPRASSRRTVAASASTASSARVRGCGSRCRRPSTSSG